MSNVPTTSAWDKHQKPVDETAFTPWADRGWKAWNGQSPEIDVCAFARMLVAMTQPLLVVETGVGQGYMTRALVPVLGDGRMVCFESDDGWRAALWPLPFWTDNRFAVTLSPNETPDEWELAQADLCVFDSDFPVRVGEIERWDRCAKRGAVALIHDTGGQHDDTTIHRAINDLIMGLEMTGFFLRNPRGAFVAVKP